MQPLVTLEWATDYFAYSRPKADEWDAANPAERRRYLGWASALIKSAFVWQSHVDIYNDDRVRLAVCEQALWLMCRVDLYPEALTKGIANASVGQVSATFSKEFVAPLICEEAKLAVSEIGSFVGKMGRVQTMPLGGVFADVVPPKHNPTTGGSNRRPMTNEEVDALVRDIFNQ